MTIARRRKLVLSTHITFTVGWFGSVAAFLALGVTGLTSNDAGTAGIYRSMEAIGWFVIVPLSLASLLTGLIQSLTTEWGLFRHYWILATLLINLLAAFVLLLFMQGLSDADVLTPRPAGHAAGALVLLFTATVLSVYKPRGLTPYGSRKLGARRLQAEQERRVPE